MTKVNCGACKRYYEKEGDDVGGGGSTGLCARCNICDPTYRELYDEEELRDMIRKERDAGIVWNGEDQSQFSQEDIAAYDRLLAEVQGERRDGVRK